MPISKWFGGFLYLFFYYNLLRWSSEHSEEIKEHTKIKPMQRTIYFLVLVRAKWIFKLIKTMWSGTREMREGIFLSNILSKRLDEVVERNSRAEQQWLLW